MQQLFNNCHRKNNETRREELFITAYAESLTTIRFPNELAPMSSYIYEHFKNIYKSYIPSDKKFTHTFDLFEMLVGLTYLNEHPAKDWMPPHLSLYLDRSWYFLEDFWNREGKRTDASSIVSGTNPLTSSSDFRTFLAKYSYEEMKALLGKYRDFAERVRRSKHFFDPSPYFEHIFSGLPGSVEYQQG